MSADRVNACLWQAASPMDREHSPALVPGPHCSYVVDGTRYWGFFSEIALKNFLDNHPRAKLRVAQLKLEI